MVLIFLLSLTINFFTLIIKFSCEINNSNKLSADQLEILKNAIENLGLIDHHSIGTTTIRTSFSEKFNSTFIPAVEEKLIGRMENDHKNEIFNEKTINIDLNSLSNSKNQISSIDLSGLLDTFRPLDNVDHCSTNNILCINKNFLLSKSSDGKFVLVPSQTTNKSTPLYENPTNRQSLQVMSLAQALYSPSSPDKNVLHLNLKGRDGKQGRKGKKGPVGLVGDQGIVGLKGNKGSTGTCEMEIISMDQCSQDLLDKIIERINYLENICSRIVPASQSPPISDELSSNVAHHPSCQSIFELDKHAKSGSYWLSVQGVKFRVYCHMENNGWTLVARINGLGHEFSPVSSLWTSKTIMDIETSDNIHLKTTMKNHGWFLIPNNAVKICLSGPNDDCAIFTHSMGIVLSQLFLYQWGITVEENWNFTSFMNALGKTCDTQKLKKQWCGLNLANICHPDDADPNLNPTNHIVRIGCIGSEIDSCSPADFAIGLGVSSCFDGYECNRVGPATPNLHWACNPFYGAIDQTAHVYVA